MENRRVRDRNLTADNHARHVWTRAFLLVSCQNCLTSVYFFLTDVGNIFIMERSQRASRKKKGDRSDRKAGRKQSCYPLKSTQLKLPDISLGKDQWMEDSLVKKKSSEIKNEATPCFEKLPPIVPPAIQTLELPTLSKIYTHKSSAAMGYPMATSSKPKLPSRFSRTLSSGNISRNDQSDESFDLYCKGTHYHRSRRIANSGLRHFSAVNRDHTGDNRITHRMKMLGRPRSKESVKIPHLRLPPSSTGATQQQAADSSHKEHCLIINFSIPLPTPDSSHHHHMMHHHHVLHSSNRRLFRPRQSSFVKMHVDDSKANRRKASRDHFYNIQFNEAEQNVTDSTALKCALDKFSMWYTCTVHACNTS